MAEVQPVTLHDPSSSLTATYVPAAGMVCTSLADERADGIVEYLGQRRGLQAYITDGKTMGIPILYPWANRLSANEYRAVDTVVNLTPGVDGVRGDTHGAPIHGVLAGNPDWQVIDQSENTLVTSLNWDADPRLLATFPFPHHLRMTVTLADRTLAVATTVTPTGARSVPLCYGYHPYVTIPGVPREDWHLQTPTMQHLLVDDRGLPTGESRQWPGATKRLGTTELDDGFDVDDGAVFTLSGGAHQIEVTFERGYGAAQLFAPGSDNVVGIEPMAAPTDALRRGNYKMAAPGNPETATFSIKVG
ncbi:MULTISPECIES: aldose 1-epimerase [unclassified Mycolicibacterium]|uniref:aldose 1-epimerase n=1 Tax=unclassified Mycolicibacterium TaxID=2636767 RepID=UPI0012DEA0B3|nr:MULTISPECIES: aldose 1-epimerase [unclassified Mycolicibacterium]MUL82003.1 aldose 1-epimerase [Mycolicibacterium sp. CBMA 329]MUL87769.1 aldose 1-epimerase [Mycolicibacterium sp. CBMA 331]MUM01593.1 aldose 1-epimerase [Mycolicibacterium sp. CBMA 334]MUM27284.1 aldose 1-epimerase [Mycolicibacterium sp. CBMA 295]MUM38066.1 aldose 1-epimerase [Mycolicibacterium sp. CBMA 247]